MSNSRTENATLLLHPCNAMVRVYMDQDGVVWYQEFSGQWRPYEIHHQDRVITDIPHPIASREAIKS